MLTKNRAINTHNIMLASALALAAGLSACKGKEAETRTHYDNPFAESSNWYVNPKWAEQARADGGESIANNSSAIWLNQTWDVEAYGEETPFNEMGLRDHMDAALEQQADLITIVLYNLPGKGCSTFGNIMGRLKRTTMSNDLAGITTYKKDYIDVIVDILSEPKYSHISVVAIIEPDTIATYIANPEACPENSNDKPWSFTEGVRYAISQLSQLKNVHSYIDAGHAALLGWSDQRELAALYMKGVIEGFEGLANKAVYIGDAIESGDGAVGKFYNIGDAFAIPAGETAPPGWDSINGFISNVANYIPLVEPNLEYTPFSLPGDPEQSLHTALFYDWNPIFGELEYSEEWYKAMREHGASDNLGMLIDTSRNGWGGENRPEPQDNVIYTNADEEVDTLRVDRRGHRRSFCNQVGAGIGERPKAVPKSFIDAYVWAKPVGESDGVSDPNFTPHPDDHLRKYPAICDPDADNPFAESVDSTQGLGIETGAMDNAPRNRLWFSDAFKELLKNAYPPIK